MQLLAHGIDIVEIGELRRLINEPGGHFMTRCFTSAEQLDAGEGPNRIDRLAGRFAAKEAVAKALGVGWGNGIAWTDIEIRTMDSGAPDIVLHRRAKEVADQLGVIRFLISTSHTGAYAIASSLALS